MRAIQIVCVNFCTFAMLVPHLAHADTTGKITLRGVVPQRAVIGISSGPVYGNNGAIVPGAPSRMSVDVSSSSSGASTMVFHLNRLANSVSGVIVKIMGDSASDKFTLTAPDGASIPYRIRFAGRDIELSDGEAELAVITRDTQDDDAGGRFEIIAPQIPYTGNAYADHIVLVVAAR